KLAEIHGPGVRVDADEAPVAGLELGRAHGVPSDNELPEDRREALDLRLDSFGHVLGGAVRDMAVRPGRVLTGRRPARVEEARLGDQDERPLNRATAPGAPFRGRNLLQRAPEMDSARAATLGRPPRDRPGERPVE